MMSQEALDRARDILIKAMQDAISLTDILKVAADFIEANEKYDDLIIVNLVGNIMLHWLYDAPNLKYVQNRINSIAKILDDLRKMAKDKLVKPKVPKGELFLG